MKIVFNQFNGEYIAEVISDRILINKTQDALDLMADCSYHESNSLILREENFVSDFFDLKTGIAGEILQKFSTYNVRLAIVGDFSKYKSKSLTDFIYESNKHGRINFVKSIDEAIEKLSKK